MRQDELCLPASVHSKAEEVKKKLTYAESVEFSCVPPPLGPGKGSDSQAGSTVRFNVTRSEFEGESCCECMYVCVSECAAHCDGDDVLSPCAQRPVRPCSPAGWSPWTACCKSWRCAEMTWTRWCSWEEPPACPGIVAVSTFNPYYSDIM